MPKIDQSLAVLLKGYTWLPDLRRRHDGRPVETRVLGRRAVGVEGPEATRFFYGEGNLERHTALPNPVVTTLFGKGAVHTLDGPEHRARKAIFVDLLMNDGVEALAKLAGEAFDEAAERWRGGPPVVLFDEIARVIAKAVTRWAGIAIDDAEVPALARDLVAMVDGFATGGPRHWRALAARHRRERWIAEMVRHGTGAPPGSALAAWGSAGIDPRTAAVELLNVIRPSTAVTWLVTYAAHAFDRWPAQRHTAVHDGDDFGHEVRRFYPFTPFLGGRAIRDLTFDGVEIPAGTLVLLDVYGQNHDPALWPDPYDFDPGRFRDRRTGAYDLIPQGGGDPRTGHRCPGEQVTVALLRTLSRRLAELDHHLPPQDMSIDLSRIPARVRSGVTIVVPD